MNLHKYNLSLRVYCALRDSLSLGEFGSLLEQGADPNAFFPESNTYSMLLYDEKKLLIGCFGPEGLFHYNTLHAALHYKSSPEHVALLCKYGVDVNQPNEVDKTPCHIAMKNINEPTIPDILRVLMRRGADLGMQDNEGNTIFHYAALNLNLNACLLLTSQKYEHETVKILLLINRRSTCKQPKPIVALICDFAFPGIGVCTDKYAYREFKSIKKALKKKNRAGLTPYQMVSNVHSSMVQELQGLEYSKQENLIHIGKTIYERTMQIHKIKKIKKLLNPQIYK